MFLTALILTVLLLAIPLRMLWLTRLAAVPGLYTSSGVWGRATLCIWPDGKNCARAAAVEMMEIAKSGDFTHSHRRTATAFY